MIIQSRISDARLDELLKNWGRWCRGRSYIAPGVVARVDYRPSGDEAMEARREVRMPPPNDQDAMLIERLVAMLPVVQRDVIRVEYALLPRRKVETLDGARERRRRRLHVARWQYEQAIFEGRGALAFLVWRNLLR